MNGEHSLERSNMFESEGECSNCAAMRHDLAAAVSAKTQCETNASVLLQKILATEEVIYRFTESKKREDMLQLQNEEKARLYEDLKRQLEDTERRLAQALQSLDPLTIALTNKEQELQMAYDAAHKSQEQVEHQKATIKQLMAAQALSSDPPTKGGEATLRKKLKEAETGFRRAGTALAKLNGLNNHYRERVEEQRQLLVTCKATFAILHKSAIFFNSKVNTPNFQKVCPDRRLLRTAKVMLKRTNVKAIWNNSDANADGADVSDSTGGSAVSDNDTDHEDPQSDLESPASSSDESQPGKKKRKSSSSGVDDDLQDPDFGVGRGRRRSRAKMPSPGSSGGLRRSTRSSKSIADEPPTSVSSPSPGRRGRGRGRGRSPRLLTEREAMQRYALQSDEDSDNEPSGTQKAEAEEGPHVSSVSMEDSTDLGEREENEQANVGPSPAPAAIQGWKRQLSVFLDRPLTPIASESSSIQSVQSSLEMSPGAPKDLVRGPVANLELSDASDIDADLTPVGVTASSTETAATPSPIKTTATASAIKSATTPSPMKPAAPSSPMKTAAPSSPMKTTATPSPVKTAATPLPKTPATPSPMKTAAPSSPMKTTAPSSPIKTTATPPPKIPATLSPTTDETPSHMKAGLTPKRVDAAYDVVYETEDTAVKTNEEPWVTAKEPDVRHPAVAGTVDISPKTVDTSKKSGAEEDLFLGFEFEDILLSERALAYMELSTVIDLDQPSTSGMTSTTVSSQVMQRAVSSEIPGPTHRPVLTRSASSDVSAANRETSLTQSDSPFSLETTAATETRPGSEEELASKIDTSTAPTIADEKTEMAPLSQPSNEDSLTHALVTLPSTSQDQFVNDAATTKPRRRSERRKSSTEKRISVIPSEESSSHEGSDLLSPEMSAPNSGLSVTLSKADANISSISQRPDEQPEEVAFPPPLLDTPVKLGPDKSEILESDLALTPSPTTAPPAPFQANAGVERSPLDLSAIRLPERLQPMLSPEKSPIKAVVPLASSGNRKDGPSQGGQLRAKYQSAFMKGETLFAKPNEPVISSKQGGGASKGCAGSSAKSPSLQSPKSQSPQSSEKSPKKASVSELRPKQTPRTKRQNDSGRGAAKESGDKSTVPKSTSSPPKKRTRRQSSSTESDSGSFATRRSARVRPSRYAQKRKDQETESVPPAIEVKTEVSDTPTESVLPPVRMAKETQPGGTQPAKRGRIPRISASVTTPNVSEKVATFDESMSASARDISSEINAPAAVKSTLSSQLALSSSEDELSVRLSIDESTKGDQPAQSIELNVGPSSETAEESGSTEQSRFIGFQSGSNKSMMIMAPNLDEESDDSTMLVIDEPVDQITKSQPIRSSIVEHEDDHGRLSLMIDETDQPTSTAALEKQQTTVPEQAKEPRRKPNAKSRRKLKMQETEIKPMMSICCGPVAKSSGAGSKQLMRFVESHISSLMTQAQTSGGAKGATPHTVAQALVDQGKVTCPILAEGLINCLVAHGTDMLLSLYKLLGAKSHVPIPFVSVSEKRVDDLLDLLIQISPAFKLIRSTIIDHVQYRLTVTRYESLQENSLARFFALNAQKLNCRMEMVSLITDLILDRRSSLPNILVSMTAVFPDFFRGLFANSKHRLMRDCLTSVILDRPGYRKKLIIALSFLINWECPTVCPDFKSYLAPIERDFIALSEPYLVSQLSFQLSSQAMPLMRQIWVIIKSAPLHWSVGDYLASLVSEIRQTLNSDETESLETANDEALIGFRLIIAGFGIAQCHVDIATAEPAVRSSLSKLTGITIEACDRVLADESLSTTLQHCALEALLYLGPVNPRRITDTLRHHYGPHLATLPACFVQRVKLFLDEYPRA